MDGMDGNEVLKVLKVWRVSMVVTDHGLNNTYYVRTARDKLDRGSTWGNRKQVPTPSLVQ